MIMKSVLLWFLAASAAMLSAQPARINQVTVLGSHNSYKLAIDPTLFATLEDRVRLGLEYSHLPLAAQLDLGLRALELDVVHDPRGGLYATPSGLRVEGATPYDPAGVMKKPGLKILHVPDVDFRSNAPTFQDALSQLRQWSDAHPRHLPVVITMNGKDEGINRPGSVKPLPFDKVALNAWDAEIRAGLPASKLLTPDDVRGSYPTLESAVLAHAWPELDRARGKFVFVLDERGKKMADYIDGHPSLRGRAMFTDSDPGTPEAAICIRNEPVQQEMEIQYLVRSGYLVRTRSDAETREARKGDYSRLKAALRSGAQIISTDYYRENPAFKTGFRVSLPGGGPGRWNVLVTPVMRPLPPLE